VTDLFHCKAAMPTEATSESSGERLTVRPDLTKAELMQSLRVRPDYGTDNLPCRHGRGKHY